MPCNAPADAWLSKGKLVFKEPDYALGHQARKKPFKPIQVPCGNCLGCKIDRSRNWTVRIIHEKQMHDESMFITLTYNNENLPKDEGLHHEHFQAFMKRYRKMVSPRKISYYMCGEYGENFGRPHYHAIIFGHRFGDLQEIKKDNYHSETLNKLWGKGFTMVGNVSFQSAGYVARYIMKKIKGETAKDHYIKCDPRTGELIEVQPEYNRMSLKPAIGKSWFEKYWQTDIKDGLIHINGKAVPVPKYYIDQLKNVDPDKYEIIMAERTKYAKANFTSEYTQQVRENRLKRNQQKRKLK